MSKVSTFFLFGTQAVKAAEDVTEWSKAPMETFQAIREVLDEMAGEVYEFRTGTDPRHLLAAFDGWNKYMEIPEWVAFMLEHVVVKGLKRSKELKKVLEEFEDMLVDAEVEDIELEDEEIDAIQWLGKAFKQLQYVPVDGKLAKTFRELMLNLLQARNPQD